ncbi:ExbD/TolR family protein [Synoicihabitans lomoniglobus]|uniref:Biopolymer transporter ExbD n=1 Tax=Synoicihabitans lomoniglobus TaxID=2909285 RepID=A0AAF0I1U7_9BACT|nr:biopolymer transporter ExbD [Opitutaceae bacterium LMO-M01]WED66042.1 biopolymer transporter ExbD [Opitutaceae bacterium LMO-M01]
MASSGGGTNADGTKKARIEIIPLIDVIFFLLATFVLFTLSLNKSGGVPVSLPNTSTSAARDPAGSVTISVTAEGTLAWDKDLISLDDFIDRLQAYHQVMGSDARILINGDQSAFFSQARYVFDEVRKAGITKVEIETRVTPQS